MPKLFELCFDVYCIKFVQNANYECDTFILYTTLMIYLDAILYLWSELSMVETGENTAIPFL